LLQTDENIGYFTKYIAEFFLERKMFRAKVSEKIKTHIVFIFFGDNVEKYGRAEQATDDCVIRRMRIA
jgi:hypothetical protein